MPGLLRLPHHLEQAIWAHALRELPRECVGVLGAAESGLMQALYPLPNIAPQPERRYLADPVGLLRALRAMREGGLSLAAIYHSHPHGPAQPSATDLALAEYRVPYLIADVQARALRAYLLPENIEVPVALV